MQKILLLGLALSFQSVFSQVSMSGSKLVKDGQTYKISKYNDVFKNPEAVSYFKKARTSNTVGAIFGGIGGAAIGVGLAEVLLNNKTVVTNYGYGTIEAKPDHSVAWLVTGIGAGLVAVGIPFAIAANKNAKKAIALENGESTAFQPYFKLESAGSGLALSYNF